MSEFILATLLSRIRNNDADTTEVSLRHDFVGKSNDFLASLAFALEDNITVTHLDISENKIRESGEKHIEYIILHNKALTHLDCSGNLFPTMFRNKVEKALQCNFSLLTLLCEPMFVINSETQNTKRNSSRGKDLKRSKNATQATKHSICNLLEQNKQISRCATGSANELSCSHRNLVLFPTVLSDLTNLKKLDLSHNALQMIPRSLYSLTALESLNLSHNYISYMENNGFWELTKLKELNLNNNLLYEIPYSVIRLESLEELNLKQNLIASIHSIPLISLQEQEIHVEVYHKLLQVDLNECPLFTRLLFIGGRDSEAHKVVHLFVKSQYSQEAYKSLSAEEMNSLDARNVPKANTIQEYNWFVPSRTIIGRLQRLSSDSIAGQRDSSFALTKTTPEAPKSRMKSRNTLNRVSRMFSSSDIEIDIPNRQRTENFIHAKLCLFDPISSEAHSLLYYNLPIFYCIPITVSPERDIENLMRFIHCTDSLHNDEPPPLFIVGTYNKGIQKYRKIMSTIIRTIEACLPHLNVISFTICTSNNSLKKNLQSKILQSLQGYHNNDFAFPFQRVITWKWLEQFKISISLFCEYIKSIQEEIQSIANEQEQISRSIITWKALTAIMDKFSIPQDQYETSAHYIRYFGYIHHHRDQTNDPEDQMGNIVFLLPSVELKAFSILLQVHKVSKKKLHVKSALEGIPVSVLPSIWYCFPRQYHDTLLQILKHYGQVAMIDEHVVVPFTFQERPDDVGLTLPAGSRDETVIRCFSCTGMNSKNFCKIIEALHQQVIEEESPFVIRRIYKNCIEVDSVDKGTAQCRITYDYLRKCCTLFVSESNERKIAFCALADELKNLFDSNKELKFRKCFAICVCVTCRQAPTSLEPPAWIAIENLEAIASSGKAFYYCEDRAVRIDLLAPDISLSNFQHLTVDYQDIVIIKKVGDGGFASVYYGVLHGKEVAVKELDKAESIAECFPEFRHEVSLMAGLQHPNTVGLLGLCKQPFCVLTEFCPYGDLLSYIESRKERQVPLPETYIMTVLLDIARGMKFLHTTMPPVLHRDLKTPNILLCRISPDEETLERSFPKPSFLIPEHEDSNRTAMVADFGLSMRTRGPLTGRVVDNPIWLAPELLSKKPYSYASDVYAFGIIANELCTLNFPFSEYKYSFTFQLEDMIISGNRPALPSENEFTNLNPLIESCWQQESTKRPTFTQIVQTLENIQKNLLIPGTE